MMSGAVFVRQPVSRAQAARLLGLIAGGGLALAGFLLPGPLDGQESSPEQIPLERCDQLPVAVVRVDGKVMRFLVDTAATSMLNLESFPEGEAKELHISTWRGTSRVPGREVRVDELVWGGYRLGDLTLPAVDLSPIARACGGRIDGILGIDLLEKMGAAIDLKRRVALLPRVPVEGEDPELEAYLRFHRGCVQALNRADADSLAGCFDPEVVLLSPWGDYYGREEVLDYLRRRYFTLDPPARFDFTNRDVRLLGEAVWFGYDYTINVPDGVLKARGTGMCRRTEEGWRMVIMHNTLEPRERPAEP